MLAHASDTDPARVDPANVVDDMLQRIFSNSGVKASSPLLGVCCRIAELGSFFGLAGRGAKSSISSRYALENPPCGSLMASDFLPGLCNIAEDELLSGRLCLS